MTALASMVSRGFARLAGLFSGSRADDDAREELESHLEMETAENIRRGMDPANARRAARLASGGVTQAAEAIRDQRRLPWLESIAADVRYAIRALRLSPAFTTVVVLTLALGIGANTAIFSVVRGVLLKPLPHKDGDRLLYLQMSADGPGQANLNFSVPEVADLRAGVASFSGIAEYSPFSFTLRGDNDVVNIDAGLVTGNYFEVMGLSADVGRLTRPGDDGPGAAPVMILTHEYWMKRFGGDSGIVGQQVHVDNTSVTVIGVLQRAPFFPAPIDVLFNMVVSPHHVSAQMVQNRSHRMTQVVARLAPGATLAQAKAEVAAVELREHVQYADVYGAASHYRIAVTPFKEAFGERAKLTLWLLMAAAAFVLIISAANVANLTLMRGVRREHELVVRAALGAGVSRLRRLLLVENLALTLTGAALGVIFATGGVSLLITFAARFSTRANEIRMDYVVLGFTLALAVALALLLSFAASLPGERTLSSVIAAGARRITGGLGRQHLQRGLVVTQVAVSVVLLAGAGLLTRSMIQLSEVSTGLKTEDVLTMPVPLLAMSSIASSSPAAIFAADADAKERFDRMRRTIRALPGVVEVGVGSTIPLHTSPLVMEVAAEDKPPVVGEAVPRADLRTAGPEYFRAAGIPLVRGREFEATDGPGGGRVVIINQALADRYFPGEDPIGKRLAWRSPILRLTPFSGDWRTVVGVVGNTKDGGMDAAQRFAMFMPFAQEMSILGALVIRADSNTAALATAATRVVHAVAPTVPIQNVMTVAQIKDQSVAPRRLNAELISMFGVLALIIASVGIAGVLAFSVSARTNEIGIRMSLGADRGRVQRMILGEGGVLLAIGLGVGVVGAYFTAGAMRGLLFGIAPHDPVTLISVALLMGAIGIVACWIPALRAARVDPMIAMRAS